MSLKEEKEYDQIEKGVKFDVAKGRWCASYPWLIQREELPNNRCMAHAILKSTEKRLLKNPDRAKLYNEQIKDMLERKAARLVTDAELSQ